MKFQRKNLSFPLLKRYLMLLNTNTVRKIYRTNTLNFLKLKIVQNDCSDDICTKELLLHQKAYFGANFW